MTPEQALDFVCKHGLWKREDPLPEKAVLVLYEQDVDGKRISHRFRVTEGKLVLTPKEDSHV